MDWGNKSVMLETTVLFWHVLYNCCPENSVLFEDDMMEHGDSLTKNSVSGEHGLSYIYAKCFLVLVFFLQYTGPYPLS